MERELRAEMEQLRLEYLAAGQAVQGPYAELQVQTGRSRQQLAAALQELSEVRQSLGAELEQKEARLVAAQRDLEALQVGLLQGQGQGQGLWSWRGCPLCQVC